MLYLLSLFAWSYIISWCTGWCTEICHSQQASIQLLFSKTRQCKKKVCERRYKHTTHIRLPYTKLLLFKSRQCKKQVYERIYKQIQQIHRGINIMQSILWLFQCSRENSIEYFTREKLVLLITWWIISTAITIMHDNFIVTTQKDQ